MCMYAGLPPLIHVMPSAWQEVSEHCRALQCLAAPCSAWQCLAERCSALQSVAVHSQVRFLHQSDSFLCTQNKFVKPPAAVGKAQSSTHRRRMTYRAGSQLAKIEAPPNVSCFVSKQELAFLRVTLQGLAGCVPIPHFLTHALSPAFSSDSDSIMVLSPRCLMWGCVCVCSCVCMCTRACVRVRCVCVCACLCVCICVSSQTK